MAELSPNIGHELPVNYTEFMHGHPDAGLIIDQTRQIEDFRSGASTYDRYHGPKWSEMPGHLGSGMDKVAFDLDDGYVLKVLRTSPDYDGYTNSSDEQIDPLLSGLEVKGLEQIVTADKKAGVIVTEKAPGLPIVDIPTVKLLRAIKPDHLEKLEETLKQMVEKELECEGPENVMFDPIEGFTIIDYRYPWPALRDTDREDNPLRRERYEEDHALVHFLERTILLRRKVSEGLLHPDGEMHTHLENRLGKKIGPKIGAKVIPLLLQQGKKE